MLSSFKSLAETDLFSMFTPKRQLVGLDIGSSGIKLVQLKESRGRYILQKFGFKPLEPEVIVDGTVMDEGRVVSAIKELFEETKIKVNGCSGVKKFRVESKLAKALKKCRKQFKHNKRKRIACERAAKKKYGPKKHKKH